MTEQAFPPGLRDVWLRMASDPVFFANTLLPLKPHPGQVRWLTEANQNINVLVPGNRFGKSTVIAMRHIWMCMFKAGARPTGKQTWMTMPYETISAAHSADQAEIVFSMARKLLDHPAIKPFVKRIYSTPFPRIVFYNGAVFHCRSAHDGGKYLDGHAYRFVSIDEAGYIDNLKDLMNGVIIMRLAGGGMVDLIGTPKGYGDLYWYAQRGMRGVTGYYTQRGSIFDNPHLPPEDIKRRDELLRHADPRLREQVIYGEFVSMEGMAFTKDQLDNLFVPDMAVGVPYQPGHRYVQAWDLGRRTDWTVGITLDRTVRPYPLVDFQRLNKVPWETIYQLIGEKAKEYHVHSPIIDATGPQGDVIEEELAKRGVFVEPVRVSTRAQKTDLINTLQSALDYGREQIGERMWLDEAGIEHMVPDLQPPGEGNWGLLRVPAIPQLVDEMGVYQLDDKDLTQDCVMALAMAVQGVYDGVLLLEPVPGSLFDDPGDDDGWEPPVRFGPLPVVEAPALREGHNRL